MSGVAKAVGKVFSGIANVVKKVALPLLGVAAIVMTGGAALGLPALAGGFGGAVSSGLAAMGAPANGVLASVLTQAGTGAAIGGVSSLATGGDFAKGAAMGAAGGALTGGVTGLLGATGAAAAPAATMSSRSLPGLGAATAPAVQTGAVIPSTSLAANPGAVLAPAAAAPTGGLGGVMGGLGRFISNPNVAPIIGNTISGLGQGLMQGMAAKDAGEAEREEQERITQSYSIAPSAFGASYVPTANTGNPTVEQKYGRRPTSRYRYDRTRREIVRD